MWQRWWVIRQRSAGVRDGFGTRRLSVTVALLATWISAVVITPGFASSYAGPTLVIPVLLLWRARVGAAAGVLFAAADVLLVDDVPQHLPFVVHGVLSLIGYLVLGRSARVEPRAEPAVRRHPYFDDAEPRDRLRWRPGLRSWATAAGLVIAVAAAGEGQRDVGAWLVAVAFVGALALLLHADERARRRVG